MESLSDKYTSEEIEMLLLIEDKLANDEPLNKEERLFKKKIYERNKAQALKPYKNIQIKPPVGKSTTIGFNKAIKDKLKKLR